MPLRAAVAGRVALQQPRHGRAEVVEPGPDERFVVVHAAIEGHDQRLDLGLDLAGLVEELLMPGQKAVDARRRPMTGTDEAHADRDEDDDGNADELNGLNPVHR